MIKAASSSLPSSLSASPPFNNTTHTTQQHNTTTPQHTTAGTLPSTLAASFAVSAGNFTALDLSGNELSGLLPAAWGSAGGAFKALRLGRNYLSGPLPATWAPLLLGGGEFDVAGNQLNGPLPDALWASVPVALQAALLNGDAKQYRLALRDNPCLCGAVPPWLDAYVDRSQWANGTTLGANCTSSSPINALGVNCSAPAPLPPPPAHPDMAPLQALKAAATGVVPGSAAAAALATWAPDRVPCSEFDAACVPCTLALNASQCGAPAPVDLVAPTLPRWYCNYQGVACSGEGRVTGVGLAGLGVGLSSLPASLGALDKLQSLSELEDAGER